MDIHHEFQTLDCKLGLLEFRKIQWKTLRQITHGTNIWQQIAVFLGAQRVYFFSILAPGDKNVPSSTKEISYRK